jgi:hypothetical protein
MPVLKTIFAELDVELLVPYEKNPRLHSKEQIQQLSNIINRVGYIDPIIIDEKNMILAGHGRALACNELNIKNVNCLQVFGLTDSEKKAYIIADNKLALNSTWDFELLQDNVASILASEEFDTSSIELIGFNMDELNSLNVDAIPEFIADISEGKDPTQQLKSKDLLLIVKFETLDSQQELFLELNERGYKVKV